MSQNASARPVPSAMPLNGAEFGKPVSGWRERCYSIVFESDTRTGRWFDLCLMAAIFSSVAIVILDSLSDVSARFGRLFDWLEWGFTLLFTAEYFLRLVCVRHPWKYALSFYGIIDLLSILPTYAAIVFPELHALLDVRVLRLLRAFRILKLFSYVAEYRMLLRALTASRRKIMIFLSFVFLVVLVLGTAMYVVEGPENGFTSIPTAVYWAITAVTTVGFGDIVPKTDLGRAIAAVMMLIGWGTLAVPTGILSAELTAQRVTRPTRTCPECLKEGLEDDAKFCSQCGTALPSHPPDASG